MRNDLGLVPKWIGQIIDAKDRLFAFMGEMEARLKEIRQDMDFLKNPANVGKVVASGK